jgi:hypothetical membrane protein
MQSTQARQVSHRSWPTSSAWSSVGAATHAAGVLFIALGVAFVTGIMVLASIAPDYDYSGAAISDLGVISQTALLFNVLLVAVGTLNIVGGYLFYREHGSRRLFALYAIAGVGAIGAGLMPLSTGAPHSLFALAGFVFFNLEAIATARVLTGAMRVLSIVAGAIGLLYVVIMVIGDGGNRNSERRRASRTKTAAPADRPSVSGSPASSYRCRSRTRASCRRSGPTRCGPYRETPLARRLRAADRCTP